MTSNTAERAALLNLEQARAILGVSRRSMMRLIAAGSLEQVRIAGLGAPRYRRADIEKLVEEGRSP
jgi:predicted DNA-binding transcriptional regulator AlpA